MKAATVQPAILLLTISRGWAYVPVAPETKSRSRTTLHMAGSGNIIDRFFRVSRANINKVLSTLEDPEKIVVQAVTDMQNDLIKVRQAYAEATATQRRLQREQDMLENSAKDWHRRAQLAMKNGNEVLAKEALTRRQSFLDRSSSIRNQLDQQKGASDKLYSAMMQLEGKIQDASAKKQQLVARARTAKSTQQVNDMLSGLTGKTSMDAFNRMEEKVEALEAAADVSGEFNVLGGSTIPNIEMEFQLLEVQSDVDLEMEKLKADLNLLGPANEMEQSLPSKPGRRSIPIEETKEKELTF